MGVINPPSFFERRIIMQTAAKIAKILRTSNNIVVKKRNDYEWIVSNTHIALFISNKDYEIFKEKWNSYKSTDNIPDVNEWTTVGGGKQKTPDFESVIPNIKKEIHLIAKLVSIETGYIHSAIKLVLEKDEIIHSMLGEDYIQRTMN